MNEYDKISDRKGAADNLIINDIPPHTMCVYLFF